MGNAIIYWDVKLIILSAISLFNGLFGFYILFRNHKSLINRSFFAFVICLVFWAITILAFFTTPDLEMAKIAMQFSYFSAILIGLSFLHFANIFPFRHFEYQPLSKIGLLMATILTALIIFSPNYLVEDVFVNNGIRDVSLNRLGHIVFAFYFLTISCGIIYTFLSKYLKSDGVIKIQLKGVIIGCLSALALGIYFNLILPALGNHHYIWLGPYFTIAITLFAGYTLNVYKKIK